VASNASTAIREDRTMVGILARSRANGRAGA
jgi:hypothetical protein